MEDAPIMLRPFAISTLPDGTKVFKVNPEARCYKSLKSMLGLWDGRGMEYEIEITVRRSDSAGGSSRLAGDKP